MYRTCGGHTIISAVITIARCAGRCTGSKAMCATVLGTRAYQGVAGLCRRLSWREFALPAPTSAAKLVFGVPSWSGRPRPDLLGTRKIDFDEQIRAGSANSLQTPGHDRPWNADRGPLPTSGRRPRPCCGAPSRADRADTPSAQHSCARPARPRGVALSTTWPPASQEYGLGQFRSKLPRFGRIQSARFRPTLVVFVAGLLPG